MNIFYEISENKWSVEDTDNYKQIFLSVLKNKNNVINFEKIKIKLKIIKEEETLFEEALGEDIEILSNDQPFLASFLCSNLKPNEEYMLYMSYNNNSDIFMLKTPKPESPYASWLWNDQDKEWQPPIKKPEIDLTSGLDYYWDEDKTDFVSYYRDI